MAREALIDWERAKATLMVTTCDSFQPSSMEIAWKKLPLDYLKCNIDASFFAAQEFTGFGMCLRNHDGHFVMARVAWMNPCLQVHEGEVLDLFQAIQWAFDKGETMVLFETDCQ